MKRERDFACCHILQIQQKSREKNLRKLFAFFTFHSFSLLYVRICSKSRPALSSHESILLWHCHISRVWESIKASRTIWTRIFPIGRKTFGLLYFPGTFCVLIQILSSLRPCFKKKSTFTTYFTAQKAQKLWRIGDIGPLGCRKLQLYREHVFRAGRSLSPLKTVEEDDPSIRRYFREQRLELKDWEGSKCLLFPRKVRARPD